MIIVQKYGGTSVGNVERIQNVARRVLATQKQGHQVVVIAGGLYRIFAKSLRGYERSRGRQIFRRFLDTTARVVVSEETVTVQLPRRTHNPILIDSGLIGSVTEIPWWNNRRLKFEII